MPMWHHQKEASSFQVLFRQTHLVSMFGGQPFLPGWGFRFWKGEDTVSMSICSCKCVRACARVLVSVRGECVCVKHRGPSRRHHREIAEGPDLGSRRS